MSQSESPTHDDVSATDLSTFEKEVLFAITEIEAAGDEPYGLAIKSRLEDQLKMDVNHGRLYPNLDELVERGLIEKSELDKRTNEYSLTGAGKQLITEYAQRLEALAEKL
ncbi:Transcriptional regulator PadR-like family protein [Halorientalis persicus]|jgi:DNA-binding PadR family transcriptional regulator|uniref:Transcriptional regulator PadR-like family protein n=1 Tax=Halorientalis persicus TaxID=1367881 RepID=A0A1H8VRV7_9EURY|nr:helix-turn-helix transcriptional regulator [Halorientalis persicus]SEP18013.1 Transcriptional regulator PadR-like family protein [Halorientalis persicus]